MGYRSTRQCVNDLQRHGHLLEVTDSIDAHLQMAEIQRRVYANGGPALLFSNVKDCEFPMVSNLFGTLERARYIFRDTIENVRRAIELKIDPALATRHPFRYWRAPFTAMAMRPKQVRRAAVLACQTTVQQLPQLVSWPEDGGPFITLPQVYSEHPLHPGLKHSNLGMYRIQLSGNDFEPNREIGLHYQIHRSIGVHHQAALEAGVPFRVNIFVGGAPSMTLSAVMPLPEGMSELTFAGALAGHRIPMKRIENGSAVYADADFCIGGVVHPAKQLPEGPFGDHLGYYSLAHPQPVLVVDRVCHRRDAIWPFTVVGRPPQEDTVFGELIHELTGPIIPTVLPGVKGVHAVDAAGVHPLLLAIGSERYTPYQMTTQPQELLTQANAILGQGQLSLAKYLMIIDQAAAPELKIHDISAFFVRLLERIDWRRDLHFQTKTTIDSLDYSGDGMNRGSKVVMAAAGPPIRGLPTELPTELDLPAGFRNACLCLPGVLALEGPAYPTSGVDTSLQQICDSINPQHPINRFPMIVVVDRAEFASQSLNNLLWVTFTRSNPASDLLGIGAETQQKHWGCTGSLVIDARKKPHHAPPLVEDAAVSRSVDAMATRGTELSKYL